MIVNSKKPNRFSPVGPLCDAALFAFGTTIARISGYRGITLPFESLTLNPLVLGGYFLEGFTGSFLFFYILRIIGVLYPLSFCAMIIKNIRRKS